MRAFERWALGRAGTPPASARGALGPLERLRALVAYFERCAQTDPSFEPEAEVARRVVALLEGRQAVEAAEVRALLRSLDGLPHYDGTGWMDFNLQVEAWLQGRAEP